MSKFESDEEYADRIAVEEALAQSRREFEEQQKILKQMEDAEAAALAASTSSHEIYSEPKRNDNNLKESKGDVFPSSGTARSSFSPLVPTSLKFPGTLGSTATKKPFSSSSSSPSSSSPTSRPSSLSPSSSASTLNRSNIPVNASSGWTGNEKSLQDEIALEEQRVYEEEQRLRRLRIEEEEAKLREEQRHLEWLRKQQERDRAKKEEEERRRRQLLEEEEMKKRQQNADYMRQQSAEAARRAEEERRLQMMQQQQSSSPRATSPPPVPSTRSASIFDAITRRKQPNPPLPPTTYVGGGMFSTFRPNTAPPPASWLQNHPPSHPFGVQYIPMTTVKGTVVGTEPKRDPRAVNYEPPKGGFPPGAYMSMSGQGPMVNSSPYMSAPPPPPPSIGSVYVKPDPNMFVSPSSTSPAAMVDDEREVRGMITADQIVGFLRDRKITTIAVATAALERITELCSPSHLAVLIPSVPRAGGSVKGEFARTPVAFQISSILNRWGPIELDPISNASLAAAGVVGGLLTGVVSTVTTVATLGYVNLNAITGTLTANERFACSIFSAVSSLCEGNALNQSNFSALGSGFIAKLIKLWLPYMGTVGVGGAVTGGGNVKVSECALRCVRYLCRYVSADGYDAINSLVCSSFGEAGGCEAVIQALRQYGAYNDRVADEGLSALRNLTDDLSVDNRAKIMRIPDAVATILRTTLAHGMGNPLIATSGMLVIRNIATESIPHTQALILAGSCEAAVEVLAKYASDQASVAHACLYAIETLSATDEGRRRIGKAGGCEWVVVALQIHVNTRSAHVGVAHQSTMCIYWLSSLQENKSRLFNLNSRALLQQLVIDNPRIKDEGIRRIARDVVRV